MRSRKLEPLKDVLARVLAQLAAKVPPRDLGARPGPGLG